MYHAKRVEALTKILGSINWYDIASQREIFGQFYQKMKALEAENFSVKGLEEMNKVQDFLRSLCDN